MDDVQLGEGVIYVHVYICIRAVGRIPVPY